MEGTAGRTHEGTGIGLALVQELVKLHGGTITAESESGAGTKFTVSLPFGVAHLPQDRVGQTREKEVRAQNRVMFENEASGWLPSEAASDQIVAHAKVMFGHTPSILLVEDNADMREYVRWLLQGDGYDIHVAEDGQAALTLAAQNSYDLIVSDVMMPRVDGIQLLQAIRKDARLKTTPFLLLSARAGEEFRVQGLGAGADDYLTKPFTARELLSRVSAHIDSHLRRKESEERLNLALELGRMGTWDVDLNTNAMYWSPGEYELFGYSAEDSAPSWDAWQARIHPDDLPNVLKKWTAAKKEHVDLRLEFRVCLPDRTTRWIEGRARFFYDANGTAYRVIGASRDITERRLTEEKLRSGRDRRLEEVKGQRVALKQSAQEVATQAELLDLSHDAAYISDLENKITYWNRGAERLYGWTKDEAIGRDASELLQTEFPVSYQDVISSLSRRGVWEGELEQTTRYGYRMTVSSRWTYRRDAEGTPIGWLEVNSDLTLQKQAQEAARRLSARILQVQDLERRKLARDLHDSLGQYLASVKINIHSSMRNLNSESSRKLLAECTEMIEQCLSETRTISYLLHPPLLDETGLGSAIRWYVEGFAQRSGIDVSVLMPESVPRFSKEIETAMFRILQESLTNAHRHAKTDRVRISLEIGPHTVALAVKDFGCGIALERLRLFRERNEGVGVGLGGMRERARELGGSLSIAPGEDNVGTTVSVEIPIVARRSEDPDSDDAMRARSAS